MSGVELRGARPQDVPLIEGILKAEMLPPLRIREWLETFWVLERDGRVLGCAGIESYGEAIVLRSVVVDPSLRGTGEGIRLIRHALNEARRRGARRAYLFTGSASGFFSRFGFEECEVGDFEPEARESWQWQFMSSNAEIRAYVTAMRSEL
jgi:amino-acid N-acetyltransferase